MSYIKDSIYHFEVLNTEKGERIDKYISSKMKYSTRSEIQSFILNSQVFLNGKVENNCNKKLKTDDIVKLTSTSKSIDLEPYNIDLDLIHEDDDLIVINKPAGLAVHPGKNTQNNTLANALIAYCKNLSSVAGSTRPGIVHRLDKDTSGLMLVAKNNETHIHLSTQIIKRNVKRKYLALTYGVPNPVIGQITTNIAPSKKDPTKMQVVNNMMGKIAITNYRVLKIFENRSFSLVECELETGRTHQIRVHMRYKNTPIVGDQKYSNYYNFNLKALSSKVAEGIKLLCRQALHAYQISFIHPNTQKIMNFQTSIDKEIQKIIDLLKTDK